MRICFSTCPPAVADELAAKILERRLAACVNVVGPVRSHYRWQGKVTCDEEALLILKTSDGAAGELMAYLTEIHPYEVPEIVMLEAGAVLPAYLSWVERETSP